MTGPQIRMPRKSALKTIAPSVDASRVQFIRLPFYEIQQVGHLLFYSLSQLLPRFKQVMPPKAFTLNARCQNGVFATAFTFALPQEYAQHLAAREDAPKPRYEIQLRMAICDATKEQQDAYPNGVRICVNGIPATLPASFAADLSATDAMRGGFCF